MSAEAPEILLAHHLKALKLPTFLREHQKLARQCATEGLDHLHFLARLVEMELIDRERRMVERRIKAAKFPAVKSLDSFDFAAIPRLISLLTEQSHTLALSSDSSYHIPYGPIVDRDTLVVARAGSPPRFGSVRDPVLSSQHPAPAGQEPAADPVEICQLAFGWRRHHLRPL